jgi:hypothetical protein
MLKPMIGQIANTKQKRKMGQKQYYRRTDMPVFVSCFVQMQFPLEALVTSGHCHRPATDVLKSPVVPASSRMLYGITLDLLFLPSPSSSSTPSFQAPLPSLPSLVIQD